VPRYLRQRDNFRCGPVAILNALKWAYPYGCDGLMFTKANHLWSICKICKTDNYGTDSDDFHGTLRAYFPYVRRVFSPTVAQINRHLGYSRPLILGHSYTRDDGVYEEHYVFCLSNPDYGYRVVNGVDTNSGEILKPTVRDIPFMYMLSMITSKNAEAFLL